ncbi:IS3 family transposase [Arcanobacterium buesumense]|uniref:IS3 family transposase n=1 Tax=Arcanobacterium buesumense TaxID=2722751 RepID=A0A6H2EK91_9ACTO|nr:IS3 family transposase [Arcanobacterium buesumense]QJC21403.1 IS3 family transposase [Arcanobacterium buesumense]
MGRVRAGGDNAVMESFFALLQKNVGNRHSWASRGELSVAITDWIEGTYHRNHRQNRLGKQTPIQYEDIIKPAIK